MFNPRNLKKIKKKKALALFINNTFITPPKEPTMMMFYPKIDQELFKKLKIVLVLLPNTIKTLYVNPKRLCPKSHLRKKKQNKGC